MENNLKTCEKCKSFIFTMDGKNCAGCGESINYKMENKTKEQLAEDKYPLINAFHLQNTAIKTGFYDGWEARQPEIDELKSIISGKTFHNETEVLKAEIDALNLTIKELSKQLTDIIKHYKP